MSEPYPARASHAQQPYAPPPQQYPPVGYAPQYQPPAGPSLTPQQQAWHQQQWQARQQMPLVPQHAPPPPPLPVAAARSVNVAAIVSLGTGLLGLLVLPIVLGPTAMIAGFVGYSTAAKSQGPGSRMSAAGIVLGGLCTLIVVGRMGGL